MRDAFRGYDQWKTASPYDDEMPELEGLIPRFPVECPCCRYNGNADGLPILAEWYEHETPGDDEFEPEWECGWHCEECDWQQECLPEDWRNDATPPYAQQIANMRRRFWEVDAAIRKAQQKTAWVYPLSEMDLPEEDFSWTDEEAGDWHVYDCGRSDCPVQWHKIAFAWDIFRENGVLNIECRNVDEEGDGNINTAWVDDGEEKWEDSWTARQMATEIDTYFLGWAEYWLYCASSMTDVLGEAIHGPHTMRPGQWIEFCLKAAEDNLNSASIRAERISASA